MFKIKVAYRAEFDTEDPPLQGFTVLQKLCDMLQELGCDDEAKELARATHVLKTCSPSRKSECEAEMSNSSNQSIFVQMKLNAREILHEFATYRGEEINHAVEQEKFQWAQLVKGVRENIILTSHTKLEQMDEHASIVACIAENRTDLRKHAQGFWVSDLPGCLSSLAGILNRTNPFSLNFRFRSLIIQ